MGYFFRIDFDIILSIKYGFEMPKDNNREKLEEHLWTKKQREDFKANCKAKYLLLNMLPV